MGRTFKAEGIVLKRVNYKEADRLVTIFTREYGKLTAIAKGVRRLTSKKRGSLEPATRAHFYFVEHRSHFILTQADLIHSYQTLQQSLVRIAQTYQLLEIVNLLTVEQQELPEMYSDLTNTLDMLSEDGQKKDMLILGINRMLQSLGFLPNVLAGELELQSLIESLANRSLNSKKFLTVNSLRV